MLFRSGESYRDSEASKKSFIYTKEVEQSVTEEKVTIKSNLNGMTKKDIVSYFDEIGVNNFQIVDDENTPCSSSTEELVSIEGIRPGSTYARSILDRMEVKCTFCKLQDVQREADSDAE